MSKRRVVGLFCLTVLAAIIAIVLAGKVTGATFQYALKPVPKIDVLAQYKLDVGIQVGTANNTTAQVGCINYMTYWKQVGPKRYKQVFVKTSSLQPFLGTKSSADPKWYFQVLWITQYHPGETKHMWFKLRFAQAGIYRLKVRLQCSDVNTRAPVSSGSTSYKLVAS